MLFILLTLFAKNMTTSTS